MQNVVGPTLVAMATKFGLGAEIHRLPACFYFFRVFYMHIIQLWESSMASRTTGYAIGLEGRVLGLGLRGHVLGLRCIKCLVLVPFTSIGLVL